MVQDYPQSQTAHHGPGWPQCNKTAQKRHSIAAVGSKRPQRWQRHNNLLQCTSLFAPPTWMWYKGMCYTKQKQLTGAWITKQQRHRLPRSWGSCTTKSPPHQNLSYGKNQDTETGNKEHCHLTKEPKAPMRGPELKLDKSNGQSAPKPAITVEIVRNSLLLRMVFGFKILHFSIFSHLIKQKK